MARKPLVVANWKMRVPAATAPVLARQCAAYCASNRINARVVICPSFEQIDRVRIATGGTAVRWGAQDCSESLNGSFTGEVSARELQRIGCSYVLIGHSERRTQQGETDGVIARKLAAVLSVSKLAPILCVGENASEKKAGKTDSVLTRQISQALKGLPVSRISRLIVAYEPVWAIGTDDAMPHTEFEKRAGFLRKTLTRYSPGIRILYGGSVTADNVRELTSHCDGVLVGTSSQSWKSFRKLLATLGV